MTRAYFVSDLHLGDPDEPRTRLFERLLDRIENDAAVTHLVLLGDIFDMWLGDHDYFISRYRRIVDSLKRIRSGGVEILYFEGNHDLHLAPFWSGELGFDVHPGPAYLELGDRVVRLEHGDQMDPGDRGYIFLRWFLRTPPMRFLILHLPGRLVAWIGERASAHSRTYTSETKTISPDGAIGKIRRHAAKAYADKPFDLLISGHVHVRDDATVEGSEGHARSVNLGTWLDRPGYFLLDGETAAMVELDPGDMAQSAAPAPAEAMSSP